MAECPPMPELKFKPEPCWKCGAVTEKDAETMCKPSTDQTGERYCGSDFYNGFAVAPTEESALAMDAWINLHHGCEGECKCQPLPHYMEFDDPGSAI